jgi:hypothetical protein
MSTPGPLLEHLLRRLAETPVDMLAAPAVGNMPGVEVGAIAGDVLRNLGLLNPQTEWLAKLHPAKADKKEINTLRVMLIASWLLADPWFQGKANPAAAQNWLYGNSIAELAALAHADAFVKDDERREELARLCLKALDFTPQGENEAQAQDRLVSISGVERKRVIEAARHVQEEARKRRAIEEARARKVREEMERKAAEEAAAKGTRE